MWKFIVEHVFIKFAIVNPRKWYGVSDDGTEIKSDRIIYPIPYLGYIRTHDVEYIVTHIKHIADIN